MKIIEKKCPNCGAGLSFNENAKSCHCDYCKREFEIERDPQDQISLVMGDVTKSFFQTFFITKTIAVVASIIFFIIFVCIAVFSFNRVSKNQNDRFNTISNTIINNHGGKDSGTEESKYLDDLSKISNSDYTYIDTSSRIAIHGDTRTKFTYREKGSIKRFKSYLAYKEDGNIFIPVYKSVYEGDGNEITLYTPVIYENVENGNVTFSMGDGRIVEDYYYFDDGGYTIGYLSIDELYEKVIKQYEGTYTISEK